MTFSERMKEILEQSWAFSKDFAAKAGAKAQDIGERSKIIWEIKQLESQAKKLTSQLGDEVYTAFMVENNEVIDRETEKLRPILDQIKSIKEQIDTLETELKNRPAV